jgi:hypothetical protein
MADALERVLRLVAAGRLTAEEAGHILDALASAAAPGPHPATADAPRFARVEVREAGRRIVDLRVPLSLGRFALARLPGLTADHLADLESAVASGAHGPILDVQSPDGDGVRIILE